MKIQYLLLISFLLTILASVLTYRSNSGQDEIMTRSEADALLQEIHYIASAGVTYWIKPTALGGGARSFIGLSNVTMFGMDTSNELRTHRISAVSKNAFTLTSTGLISGVKVVSTITNKGLSGSPTIILPS